MLSGLPGHQKTIVVNGTPLRLSAPVNIFPEQELEAKHFIQGGPRAQVYEMRKKITKGSFSFPLTVDSNNGSLDSAVQEIFECAQYPLRDLEIDTNYVLAKRYVTADAIDYLGGGANRGWGVYQKMKFESCAINKLTLTVPESGNASVNVDLIGMISPNAYATIPILPATGMMRREISYADCDVYSTTPAYHWDTSKAFNITIDNEIEPIYNFIKIDEKTTWTDQPVVVGMGISNITGEITYSVDRGTELSERNSLPTGSWIASNLIFDISGVMLIDIPHCIAELTEQPIEMGLLERKTKFVALFNKTILTTEEGHFISFR